MARRGFLGKIEDELKGNKKGGFKEAMTHLKEFVMSPTGLISIVLVILIIHHYMEPKKAKA